MPAQTVSGPSFDSPILVDAVLAFVKAYWLKGDIDSLKRLVSERFSSELVDKAKRSLWDFCDNLLSSLPYQLRRDSDRRSQLAANTEDILKAFDTLDTTNSIPDIFCEASDLPRLPSLSLDPVGEQVHASTEALNILSSTVRSIEDKISSLLSLTTSLPRNSNQQSTSYAQMASIHPPSTGSSPLRQPTPLDSRECNVIIFGLPEKKSIVETKSEVDQVLEFLVGRSISIRDLFRLGKFTHSTRPRPLLIKLATIWDRKLILAQKRKLREYHSARLFLREDVPPDHKLRQRRPKPPQDTVRSSSIEQSSSSAPKTNAGLPTSKSPGPETSVSLESTLASPSREAVCTFRAERPPPSVSLSSVASDADLPVTKSAESLSLNATPALISPAPLTTSHTDCASSVTPTVVHSQESHS